MDNVVLDHFMKVLALNIATFCPDDIGIVASRLRTHLIVMLVSTFTLLPVLIRINYGTSQQTVGVFNLPM